MKFTYKARTKEGKLETGTIQAHSRDAAAALLQKYDVFVVDLQEEAARKPLMDRFRFLPSVSKKNLVIFFRQLSVMLQSRVPVVQSITSLAAQERNTQFRSTLNDVASAIEEGLPLSAALAGHPATFSELQINLIKAGEASGNIAAALGYVADYLEREHDIFIQIRQAMMYPFFVVCVLIVVLGIIMVEVMPRIGELVLEQNTQPPLFTRIILAAYQFLSDYWMILAGFLLLVVALLLYAARTKDGKRQYERIALSLPIAGEILKKVFVSRFCNTISTLLVAGVSITNTLKIASRTVNNTAYQEIINEVEQEVARGEKISAVLARYPDYVPPFVTQMIKVGEETGTLDTIAMEIVRFYQKEIKSSIDIFSTLLEPLMVIVLGVVVATLAISVLSPLYGALGSI